MYNSTLVNDVDEILSTRYMGFASFTILVWDHILTFPAEVEYIWKGSKSSLIYLFLVNRYLMPLGFIVNIVAYNLKSWAQPVCERYVRYEGIMTSLGIEIVGIMMLIRVHALYRSSRTIVAAVASILLAETVVNVWLLIHATAVPHFPDQTDIHSCSMKFHDPTGGAASAWIPLLYDTIVFILTLHRTLPSIRRKESGFIMRTIVQDGLIYYGVICSVTLALTIMITKAPPGVQNLAAQLELLLTVTMMSRITINLKKKAHSPTVDGKHTWDDGAYAVSFSRERSNSTSTTRMKRSSSITANPGGGDLPLTFVRPGPPVRALSIIYSEENSGMSTPVGTHLDTFGQTVSVDLGPMLTARVRERMGMQETWTPLAGFPRRGDEETL